MGEGGLAGTGGHPMRFFMEKPGQFICWRLPGGLASHPKGNPASSLQYLHSFIYFIVPMILLIPKNSSKGGGVHGCAQENTI